MKDEFDRFVREQLTRLEDQGGPVDAEKERAMWLGKLDELYALIRRSLKRYLAKGMLDFRLAETMLEEEWLGKYAVHRGSIYLARKVVEIEPKGTIYACYRGVVDMEGPCGTARFVLVPPDALRPRVHDIFPPSDAVYGPDDPRDPPHEEWIWKIRVTRPIAYVPLVPENFRETLMGVIRGYAS